MATVRRISDDDTIENRIKMKTLVDVYLCLGQAFQEHTKYKSDETGHTLYKIVVRAFAEDAIPLETSLLILKQLSYDYDPAKQLWRVMKKVADCEKELKEI